MLQHGSSFAKTLRYSLLSTRFASTEGFNGQRVKYEGQLSEMRKVWLEDFARRNELKKQQEIEERKRVVQEKAVRLREKRKASVLRQEVDRKAKAEALMRFRENLARKHLHWDKKAEKQQSRFKQLAADLERESASWITVDNMDSKITADLFEQEAATTGIVTRYSNHWRYNSVSMAYEIAQLMDPSSFIKKESTLLSRFKQNRDEAKFFRRQDIEAFLEPMISTGAEREQLQDLVKEYSAAMDILEKPDHIHEVLAMEHEDDADDLESGLGYAHNRIQYDKDGNPMEPESDSDEELLEFVDFEADSEDGEDGGDELELCPAEWDSDMEGEEEADVDAKLRAQGRELRDFEAASEVHDFESREGSEDNDHVDELEERHNDASVRMGAKLLTRELSEQQLMDLLEGRGEFAADAEGNKKTKPVGWEQAGDFFDADEVKK